MLETSPAPTLDPALGQYGSLQAQLLGNHTGLSGLPFTAAGDSGGNGGGMMGFKDLEDLDGHEPARFN